MLGVELHKMSEAKKLDVSLGTRGDTVTKVGYNGLCGVCISAAKESQGRSLLDMRIGLFTEGLAVMEADSTN